MLADVTGRRAQHAPRPDDRVSPPTAPSAWSWPATTAGVGPAASATPCRRGTFGHNGAGGQIAWADPDSGISFAYLTNGLDQNVIRQGSRGVAIGSLAASALD